ncbi:alpha/beta fold hydrolase [Janthinobacterium sp. SUN073]|uniref:alpha/beta hydrolase n=1 Tax=Janthinobacterium sp. SUN073 TaxID=3004102 RepID=UPI0025B1F4A8|nr:alpha/beta fold hydrolase [Janthinobacterium sp. SUN073]MDN2694954.1 alpha/beta fold hydrolase [Janthinobacterium sp. SUN073]
MLRWMLGMLVLMVCLPVRAATGGEQEVALAVAGGVLHGTLSMPDRQGKVPVVLLHAGSGPTDRNGNSAMLPGQSNTLRMLADALARNGIATLRYDKRGIGASASAGRREADLRLDDYIDDATAWLRQLRADPRFTNVLMAGHSEGALIAMVACQRAQLDGCVLIAGAGNALDDILRVQLKPRLPPDLYAQNERILLALKRGERVSDVPPALLALYRPSVQPYLISSLKVDPRAAVGALRMPLLILQGTTDLQVSVADAQALSAAAPAARLVIVPGMNHVLKMVSGDLAQQLPSYGDPALPLAPALVDAVTAFVQER